MKSTKQDKKKMQAKELIYTGIIMLIGLLVLKFLPMEIFGKNILFDASMHITIACFVLYFIYFFIDQNKSWRIPYFMFCFTIIIIISVQRIIANAHNDLGLLLGLLVSIIAIAIPQWNQLKNKIDF